VNWVVTGVDPVCTPVLLQLLVRPYATSVTGMPRSSKWCSKRTMG
jgi:hypothetical protein